MFIVFFIVQSFADLVSQHPREDMVGSPITDYSKAVVTPPTTAKASISTSVSTTISCTPGISAASVRRASGSADDCDADDAEEVNAMVCCNAYRKGFEI